MEKTMSITKKSSRELNLDEEHLEDPFEDPALVTNAFLDILWQDLNGNSALMMAAAENRALHVKGVLTMAVDMGKLHQVLEMRNEMGQTALDMAKAANSDACVKILTKAMERCPKVKPRFRNMSSSKKYDTSEDDITIDITDEPQRRSSIVIPRSYTPPLPDKHHHYDDKKHTDKNSEDHKVIENSKDTGKADENPEPERVRRNRPFILQAPPRRLSRSRMTNNLKTMDSEEYLNQMKRSKSSNHRLLRDRTLSGDSLTTPPFTSTMSPEAGAVLSMGDRLRQLFSRKNPGRPEEKDKYDSPNKSRHPVEKYKKPEQENWLSYPQTSDSLEDEKDDEGFRSSPFSQSSSGVRLPPLNMRRRTASEGRKK